VSHNLELLEVATIHLGPQKKMRLANWFCLGSGESVMESKSNSWERDQCDLRGGSAEVNMHANRRKLGSNPEMVIGSYHKLVLKRSCLIR
jgi:hypothetical protein